MSSSEPKIQKSEQEWREQLTPAQYEVLRKAGTEPPFTGEYVYNKDSGDYRCAGCGAVLFAADTKFESGSGWPAPCAAAGARRRRSRCCPAACRPRYSVPEPTP